MIKTAEDVRVGNKLMHMNTVVTADAVTISNIEQNIKLYDKVPYYGIEIGCFQLDKMGFQDIDGIHFVRREFGKVFVITREAPDKWFLNMNQFMPYVKYVHEVQNLYYDLMNKSNLPWK